jgi:hypothetical protein
MQPGDPNTPNSHDDHCDQRANLVGREVFNHGLLLYLITLIGFNSHVLWTESGQTNDTVTLLSRHQVICRAIHFDTFKTPCAHKRV